MKKSAHTIFIVLLILGILFPVYRSYATTIRKGQVGFRFLEFPVSAETIGRGGLGSVMLSNANAVFWNPAGIGWLSTKLDLTANYTSGIADINHSSFAAAIRVGKFGILAVDALIMDYGELQGTRRANNDQGFELTGTFSPQAYVAGLSYGQKVSDRFSYGIRVKYATQNLGDAYIALTGADVDDSTLAIGKKSYSLGVSAIDIGGIYDFLTHGIRFGAVIQNVSREVRYENTRFPLPYAVSFSLVATPLSFFDGITSHPENLIVGFETRHPRDFRERVKFGAEYHYNSILVLRTGYMMNYDERGLTFGIGITKGGLRFDYAYQDYGIFNAAHAFSIGYSL